MTNNDKNISGWECPLCGRVNAPHVNSCPCSDKKNINETNQYTPKSNDGRYILTENLIGD